MSTDLWDMDQRMRFVARGVTYRAICLRMARVQLRWARELVASIETRIALGAPLDTTQLALVTAITSAEHWRTQARWHS